MHKAQSIQLSFFAPEAQKIRADVLFSQAFGQDADLVQSNRTPSPEAPFFSLAVGSTDNIDSRVQVQPGRIDLIVAPKEGAAGDSIPLFDVKDNLARVRRSLSNINVEDEKISRVAVLVQLMRIFHTLPEVTAFLLDQADIKIDLSGVSDFNMQLNRRRRLESWGNHEMNRLVTLTENIFQRVQLQFAAPNSGPRPVGINYFGGGVLVDINSAPGHEFIPAGSVARVAEEIMAEMTRFTSSSKPMTLLRETNVD